MPSLTPQHRSGEATSAAVVDGLVSAFATLIPSTAAVYAAMKNSPKFVRSTNWQSRTALAIMPPFFMYALSSEMKLNHKMREMASEADHSMKLNEWAEGQNNANGTFSSETRNNLSNSTNTLKRQESVKGGVTSKDLHALYQKSIEESGVRIIAGDSLGLNHKAANFLQEHPFKILTAAGVPTILYIFQGRNDQKHLQLQSKLMHTRVFGQFAVISLLLSLMGFKSYMDNSGKYITQTEADYRVAEMERMREDLMKRIEFDKKLKERRDAMLRRSDDLKK